MAELRTFKCDECPAIKRDANGWFIAISRPLAKTFTIAAWDATDFENIETRNADAHILHLCSESCAAKAMSKAIGAGQ